MFFKIVEGHVCVSTKGLCAKSRGGKIKKKIISINPIHRIPSHPIPPIPSTPATYLNGPMPNSHLTPHEQIVVFVHVGYFSYQMCQTGQNVFSHNGVTRMVPQIFQPSKGNTRVARRCQRKSGLGGLRWVLQHVQRRGEGGEG